MKIMTLKIMDESRDESVNESIDYATKLLEYTILNGARISSSKLKKDESNAENSLLFVKSMQIMDKLMHAYMQKN